MPIKKLTDIYKSELNAFFEQLPLSAIERVYRDFLHCEGLLIFSGVGKSALVAEKIAVTMTATGTRAIYLSPVEAMHGDIGLVTEKDLFIGISKSGETDEIFNLLPYIRNKGAKIIIFTSNPNSRLANAADLKLILPFDKELCPFNMAPTISTTAQAIIGDILAIALMERHRFTLNDYAMNHPAGTIGRRITVRVRDLMLQGDALPLCFPNDHLIDMLVVLSEKRAGCLLIIDDNKKLLGIFTDGDLRRSLQKKGPDVLNTPIHSIMTKGGLTIGPYALAWDAMKMMEKNQKSPVMVLPVIDEEGGVIGLIKMHDILQSGI